MEKRPNFMKPNVFLDIHVPLLVFQANTLNRIYREYRITLADFTVLAAGYTVEQQNMLREFANPELTKTIIGISRNVVFKCLNKLLRKGMIMLKEQKKNHRVFRLTDRGKACINSFVQYFSYTATSYDWDHHHGRFGYKRVR
jgi:predicted transcriptional regulator